MLMVAMTTTAFYLITVYAPTFGKTVLQLSSIPTPYQTLLSTTGQKSLTRHSLKNRAAKLFSETFCTRLS